MVRAHAAERRHIADYATPARNPRGGAPRPRGCFGAHGLGQVDLCPAALDGARARARHRTAPGGLPRARDARRRASGLPERHGCRLDRARRTTRRRRRGHHLRDARRGAPHLTIRRPRGVRRGGPRRVSRAGLRDGPAAVLATRAARPARRPAVRARGHVGDPRGRAAGRAPGGRASRGSGPDFSHRGAVVAGRRDPAHQTRVGRTARCGPRGVGLGAR